MTELVFKIPTTFVALVAIVASVGTMIWLMTVFAVAAQIIEAYMDYRILQYVRES